MDSLKIFKGYGKMDPSDDREFRRTTTNRFILLTVASIFLLAIITGLTFTISINKHKTSQENSFSTNQSPLSKSSFIKSICSITRYPDSCFSSLSSANTTAVATDPVTLFQISLSVASRSISNVSSFLSNLNIPDADNRLRAAVNDCKELLNDAVDRLNESSSVIASEKQSDKMLLSDEKISDIRTWISTTITDQETCLEGFEGTGGGFREKVETAMKNSTQFASNSLAIVTRVLGVPEKFHFPGNRKLLLIEN